MTNKTVQENTYTRYNPKKEKNAKYSTKLPIKMLHFIASHTKVIKYNVFKAQYVANKDSFKSTRGQTSHTNSHTFTNILLKSVLPPGLRQ